MVSILKQLLSLLNLKEKAEFKQHQLVYSALTEAMATEAIHAIALKTYTPEAWQAVGSTI